MNLYLIYNHKGRNRGLYRFSTKGRAKAEAMRAEGYDVVYIRGVGIRLRAGARSGMPPRPANWRAVRVMREPAAGKPKPLTAIFRA